MRAIRSLLWRDRVLILVYHDPKPEVVNSHLAYLREIAEPISLPDFHLETRLRKDEFSAAASTSTLEEALFNFERDLILSRLEQHHFSLAKTADQLKITRHALRYRMQRLNINIDAGPDEDTVVPVRKDFTP